MMLSGKAGSYQGLGIISREIIAPRKLDAIHRQPRASSTGTHAGNTIPDTLHLTTGMGLGDGKLTFLGFH